MIEARHGILGDSQRIFRPSTLIYAAFRSKMNASDCPHPELLGRYSRPEPETRTYPSTTKGSLMLLVDLGMISKSMYVELLMQDHDQRAENALDKYSV